MGLGKMKLRTRTITVRQQNLTKVFDGDVMKFSNMHALNIANVVNCAKIQSTM